MTTNVTRTADNARVRKLRARTAVAASKRTGAILPRSIYMRAGITPPAAATDKIQRPD